VAVQGAVVAGADAEGAVQVAPLVGVVLVPVDCVVLVPVVGVGLVPVVDVVVVGCVDVPPPQAGVVVVVVSVGVVCPGTVAGGTSEGWRVARSGGAGVPPVWAGVVELPGNAVVPDSTCTNGGTVVAGAGG
jgi:hypothetical protein